MAPEIYLDGVRLGNRTPGARDLSVLELIPAVDIRRIQVLKGSASSAMFGGVNGVILIDTYWTAGARDPH